MICEDKVFVADVVVVDPTWETMVMNVINWASATVELSAIIKIHKYKRLPENHHFIPMAIEVHDTFKHDMNSFIKECVYLFHNRWLGGHLSFSFCIQFFMQHVSITFQHVLASVI